MRPCRDRTSAVPVDLLVAPEALAAPAAPAVRETFSLAVQVAQVVRREVGFKAVLVVPGGNGHPVGKTVNPRSFRAALVVAGLDPHRKHSRRSKSA